MAPQLLGPPETHQKTAATTAAATPTGNAFMDLMVAEYNNAKIQPKPPMGQTENHSATYLSSGNPCLDFFFHVVPNTPAESIIQRLESAWNQNSLTALKLICNLRGVRGTGKSDKEGFYTCALWLHSFHPKTLACNVGSFANFGYFKDLLEILYRLLGSPDRGAIRRERQEMKKRVMYKKFRNGQYLGVHWCTVRSMRKNLNKKKSNMKGKRLLSREARIEAEKGRVKKVIEEARKMREEKRIAMAKKCINRYARDPDFRFLHERVSDYFADCLKSDLNHLESGEINKISLAAKWCPSLDSSYDRATLLSESIARKVFPRESDDEYKDIEEAHYAYRVRDRLRKQVLVPLRKVLELPEVYIGANQWHLIPYNKVASVAMKLYKEKFLKHDGQRFQEYLQKVGKGEAKIAAGALLPHEIIASLDDEEEDGGQVAELQWKRMVEDLSKEGKLRDSLAVCDVSGSMEGTPMEVSVALGVLVSELNEEPWKGKLITFSASPKLDTVEGQNLAGKTSFVRKMEWGMNTDFQKVFDLILKVAVEGKLRAEQMIKRVFVFSDMEFDQASTNNWETDYEAIVRKFTEQGYGSAVPEIVYWNLRDSRSTPTPGTQKGVALVSGFSKNLLKLFLEENGIPDAESVMEAAICGKEYSQLLVLD